MTSYLFQQVVNRGKREGIDDDVRQRDVRTWFRDQALRLTTASPQRLINDPDKDNLKLFIAQENIGQLFLYNYDAKTKDKLPYWDAFPIVFPIEMYSDGFLGINLHYLNPILRAKLLDKLYTIISDRRYDKNTKLKISYELLKGASRFKAFEPCLKRYLGGYVRSQFLNIPPRLWDYALLLPLQRFQKATAQTVWKDSEQMINSRKK